MSGGGKGGAGGGAAILEANEGGNAPSGILELRMHAEGKYAKRLWIDPLLAIMYGNPEIKIAGLPCSIEWSIRGKKESIESRIEPSSTIIECA